MEPNLARLWSELLNEQRALVLEYLLAVGQGAPNPALLADLRELLATTAERVEQVRQILPSAATYSPHAGGGR